MRTYSIHGKSANTSTAELARIFDDGQTITFRASGAEGWAIEQSTFDRLLEKYARLGYQVHDVSESASLPGEDMQ